MKPYTGTIVDTAIENGVLRVKVQYTNGEDTFNDSIETTQTQGVAWAEEQVRRRLVHLNTLPDLAASIEIGKEIKHDDEASKDLSDRDLFAADLATFNKMVAGAQMGIVSRDDPAFVALKEKLSTNFKPEYADLF